MDGKMLDGREIAVVFAQEKRKTPEQMRRDEDQAPRYENHFPPNPAAASPTPSPAAAERSLPRLLLLFLQLAKKTKHPTKHYSLCHQPAARAKSHGLTSSRARSKHEAQVTPKPRCSSKPLRRRHS